MAKKKMPPQLLEYFKSTAALDKARKAKKAAKTYKDKKEADKPKDKK
jgi:hypothetical protein